ncbi:MAG: c-type cytochrome [bacterium]|nr:c-type cytochrome [bacterium]
MKKTDIVKIAITVTALLTLIALGYMIVDDNMPQWKIYQSKFKKVVTEKLGKEKAASIDFGLKQIYLEELGRVDRCVTCHMGMEWQGLERAKNPYKSHPKKPLKNHPIKEYGCTLCHGGQGYGVSYKTAHGFVKYWDEPMLGLRLERRLDFKSRGILLQTNCNVCHRYQREVEGMSYINTAKKLVGEKSCRACHIINGYGGAIGPDLTGEGSKSKEAFEVPGIRTVFDWHVRHFRAPKDMAFSTIMPDFNFNRKEARALTMLMMSWKDVTLPSTYFPDADHKDALTEKEIEVMETRSSGEGAFFSRKGCFTCHSISIFHIDSPTNLGPDLSFAKEDVRRRFGVPLELFIENPSGTMQIVLSSVFPLTKKEKKEAVRLLNRAWEVKKEKGVPAPWEKFDKKFRQDTKETGKDAGKDAGKDTGRDTGKK